jgi:hypothetical protein
MHPFWKEWIQKCKYSIIGKITIVITTTASIVVPMYNIYFIIFITAVTALLFGLCIGMIIVARLKTPSGWRLLKDTTVDERSWSEDAQGENGVYHNTCVHCLRGFTGHKRRVICKSCSQISDDKLCKL